MNCEFYAIIHKQVEYKDFIYLFLFKQQKVKWCAKNIGGPLYSSSFYLFIFSSFGGIL